MWTCKENDYLLVCLLLLLLFVCLFEMISHGMCVTREIQSSLLVFMVLLINKFQNKLRRKLLR